MIEKLHKVSINVPITISKCHQLRPQDQVVTSHSRTQTSKTKKISLKRFILERLTTTSSLCTQWTRLETTRIVQTAMDPMAQTKSLLPTQQARKISILTNKARYIPCKVWQIYRLQTNSSKMSMLRKRSFHTHINKYQQSMLKYNKCNKTTWKCIYFHRQINSIKGLIDTFSRGGWTKWKDHS